MRLEPTGRRANRTARWLRQRKNIISKNALTRKTNSCFGWEGGLLFRVFVWRGAKNEFESLQKKISIRLFSLQKNQKGPEKKKKHRSEKFKGGVREREKFIGLRRRKERARFVNNPFVQGVKAKIKKCLLFVY